MTKKQIITNVTCLKRIRIGGVLYGPGCPKQVCPEMVKEDFDALDKVKGNVSIDSSNQSAVFTEDGISVSEIIRKNKEMTEEYNKVCESFTTLKGDYTDLETIISEKNDIITDLTSASLAPDDYKEICNIANEACAAALGIGNLGKKYKEVFAAFVERLNPFLKTYVTDTSDTSQDDKK